MGTMCMYTTYVVTLCPCALCKLGFDGVKGQVRGPSLNSMSLLTSSIYLQSFIILRRIVHEVMKTDGQTDTNRQIDGQTDSRTHRPWVIGKKTDGLTDEQTDKRINRQTNTQEDRIKHSCRILIKVLKPGSLELFLR